MFGMGGAARPATQDSVVQTDPGVHLTIIDQIGRAATRRPGLWPGRRALRPSRVGRRRVAVLKTRGIRRRDF